MENKNEEEVTMAILKMTTLAIVLVLAPVIVVCFVSAYFTYWLIKNKESYWLVSSVLNAIICGVLCSIIIGFSSDLGLIFLPIKFHILLHNSYWLNILYPIGLLGFLFVFQRGLLRLRFDLLSFIEKRARGLLVRQSSFKKLVEFIPKTSFALILILVPIKDSVYIKELSIFVFLFSLFLYFRLNKILDNQSTAFDRLKSSKDELGIRIGVLIDKNKTLKLTWKHLNHHIHILGQPGSGKSVLLRAIYSNQIVKNQGLMLIDFKADLNTRREFEFLCKSFNRCEDLQIIDLSNPDNSLGYNPLLIGNASELKDKIVGSLEWSEQYYKSKSERVLLTVLMGLVWLRDYKFMAPTLEDVLTIISSEQMIRRLANQVNDENIQNKLIELSQKYDLTDLKDIEGLKSHLALLVNSEFGQIFNKPEQINIFESLLKNKIVLVLLDGQTYQETAKKVGRLIISDLKAASGRIVSKVEKSRHPRFHVIIDEFSELVSNNEIGSSFVGFLNRCRGSGIGVTIAHQSLGDFKDPNIRSQILDSTETTFCFVQKDPVTCETMASIAGTNLEVKVTHQIRKSFIFNDKTGAGTEREVHEFKYHPNIFKNLDVGHCVYISKKPNEEGLLKVDLIKIPYQKNYLEENKRKITEYSMIGFDKKDKLRGKIDLRKVDLETVEVNENEIVI